MTLEWLRFIERDIEQSRQPLTHDCIVSPGGRFRYWLRRKVAAPAENPKCNYPGVLWVMLNPSKARAEVRDPTDRKCEGFTRILGGAEYAIVNLFAYSATKPADLFFWGYSDAIGPDNDYYLKRAVRFAHHEGWLIMCAWGFPTLPKAEVDYVQERAADVKEIIGRGACLMTTDKGFPRHPLYVPYVGDYPYPYVRSIDT